MNNLTEKELAKEILKKVANLYKSNGVLDRKVKLDEKGWPVLDEQGMPIFEGDESHPYVNDPTVPEHEQHLTVEGKKLHDYTENEPDKEEVDEEGNAKTSERDAKDSDVIEEGEEDKISEEAKKVIEGVVKKDKKMEKSEKIEKKAPKGIDPDKHEKCVMDVKAQGKDVGSAHAICTSSLKKCKVKEWLENRKLSKGGDPVMPSTPKQPQMPKAPKAPTTNEGY